ncbi:hypothetical protein [Longitalea luteola]|uniref:hypothetical protein n=1 Tax=Longitalea luteola TaxID=2812563 RepID=UPI001A97B3AE|nr:hypothetical protein [Longitalea luteola]
MKKARLMLLSLALFAIAGGALAFKANYGRYYCTAPTQQGVSCSNKFCQNLTNATTLGGSLAPFVCTTTPIDGDCVPNLRCAATSTRLTLD